MLPKSQIGVLSQEISQAYCDGFRSALKYCDTMLAPAAMDSIISEGARSAAQSFSARFSLAHRMTHPAHLNPGGEISH
jgi:hypothetical protein